MVLNSIIGQPFKVVYGSAIIMNTSFVTRGRWNVSAAIYWTIPQIGYLTEKIRTCNHPPRLFPVNRMNPGACDEVTKPIICAMSGNNKCDRGRPPCLP